MQPGTPNRPIILLVTSVASFLTAFMGSSLNIAMPLIGREFGMSATVLSWVATTYILAAVAALVPIGRVADIVGRRRVFKAGMLLFALFSGLIMVSHSTAFLLVFRALQGISAAMLYSTGVPILIAAFRPEERGKVLGINVASVYLGLSLGPFIGGLLTGQLGWRAVIGFNLLIAAAVLGFVLLRLPTADEDTEKETMDLAGAVFYCTGIVALMVGFSTLPSWQGVFLTASGGGILAIFAAWELKSRHPLLNLRLFRKNAVFTFSSLAALINYAATYSVGFLLSLYLQTVKGLTPRQAGLILVVQPAFQAVLSPLAGHLSDRIQPQTLASAGMALTALALLALSAIGPATGMPWILSALAILGISFALFSSPNTSAIMGAVERRFLGVASGMLGTMRLLGQISSMAITTLLFSLFLGEAKIGHGNLDLFLRSMKTTLGIFSFLCFLGIFASIARGKVQRQISPG